MTLILAAALVLSPGSCYRPIDMFGDFTDPFTCKVIKSKDRFIKVACSSFGDYTSRGTIIKTTDLSAGYVNVSCNERKQID